MSWHDHSQPWMFLAAARYMENLLFAEADDTSDERQERLMARCGRYYEAKRRWEDVHAAQEGEARDG